MCRDNVEMIPSFHLTIDLCDIELIKSETKSVFPLKKYDIMCYLTNSLLPYCDYTKHTS